MKTSLLRFKDRYALHEEPEMTIEEEIRQHDERVTGSVSVRYKTYCPCCDAKETFHRHDIRRRNFYYVGEDGQPRAVRSWIVRWRCGNCDMRFTDYPPFAVRSKRFVKPAIYEMATQFLRAVRSTYRSVSGHKASPSTLWRWVSWLDSLAEYGMFCTRCILSLDTDSILHRNIPGTAPWKYRSKDRGSVVGMAAQTLAQMIAFDKFYTEKYPPSWQQQTANT